MRLEEATLVREFVMRALDDRVANLRSVLEVTGMQGEDLERMRVLEAVNWRQGKTRKDFRWAFARDKQGQVNGDVEEAVRLLEAAPGGKLDIGEYTYALSADGTFLHRFPRRRAK
jgi:hypothetical protein